jgi:hypothetical protein
MADIKIALPFVPLGTAALAGAPWLKAFGNAEDPSRRYRAVTLLVCFGALLNTFGYVFVMEGPGREYRAAAQPFWRAMLSLRSNENPELATATFYGAGNAGTLLILGLTAAIRGLRMLRAATADV